MWGMLWDFAVGVAGWNPYNHYGCGSNEIEIRKQTTALLAFGLQHAGFEYINLDCGWANGAPAHTTHTTPKFVSGTLQPIIIAS